MDSQLTVIVQTSPIPSHPSLALLEALFRSFEKADGLLESRIVILCDGCEAVSDEDEAANYKHGKASPQAVSNYQEHLKKLNDAIGEPPFVSQGNGSIEVMQLPHRHGSAKAIQVALSLNNTVVQTPLVMVCQHDNFFVREIPFKKYVRLMIEKEGMGIDVKCLHFLSTATLQYQQKVLKRYGVQVEAAEKIESLTGEKLVPLLFWYGRTHLAYSHYYRDYVLNRKIKEGDHLEELLGNRQLKSIVKDKVDYRSFGIYVIDDGGDQVIYHLSGRRAREAKQVPNNNVTTEESAAAAAAIHDDPHLNSFTTARSAKAVKIGRAHV